MSLVIRELFQNFLLQDILIMLKKKGVEGTQ